MHWLLTNDTLVGEESVPEERVGGFYEVGLGDHIIVLFVGAEGRGSVMSVCSTESMRYACISQAYVKGPSLLSSVVGSPCVIRPHAAPSSRPLSLLIIMLAYYY